MSYVIYMYSTIFTLVDKIIFLIIIPSIVEGAGKWTLVAENYKVMQTFWREIWQHLFTSK